MKTKILQKFQAVTPFVLISGAFIIFSSLNKDSPTPAPLQCNIGYTMSVTDLRQFMLDSLNGFEFPGGVYAKADLLFAINSLSSVDDSVSLVNMFINCAEADGTDLALTSRHTNKVKFVRARKPCPCDPPRPCCRNIACIPKVRFRCFSFQAYTQFSFNNDKVNSYSLQQNN